MARKALLASVMDGEFTAVNSVPVVPADNRPPSRGAFGMMSRAAEEMANKAESAEELERMLTSGQTIVELDPDLIDDSFVDDRMGESREDIQDLIASFLEHGQDAPILVRPHRQTEGRFESIFGHRRKRAAKATGRLVKAVIRDLSDRDHVIAQGQENTARSDLSFIERARFAWCLAAREFDNQTIMLALGINKSVLSKMQAVTTHIPPEVIEAIGPAKDIGRDRWYELAVSSRDGGISNDALALLAQPAFLAAESTDRFELFSKSIGGASPSSRKPRQKVDAGADWEPEDRSIRVTTKDAKNAVTITLRRPDGIHFGNWISQNLEALYSEFRRTDTKDRTGD